MLVNASHQLVLRWQPYVHARRLNPAPAVSESELLRGVSDVELAFWSAGSGGSLLGARRICRPSCGCACAFRPATSVVGPTSSPHRGSIGHDVQTRRPQQGFALLIVLWTLGLLALLGTQLLATSRQDMQIARNQLDAATLEAAANGALQQGIFRGLIDLRPLECRSHDPLL